MADEMDDEEVGSTPPAAAPTAGTATPPAAGAPAPSGPDFTSLVKTPQEMAAVSSKLADIQRGKSASNAAIAAETTSRLDTDRARMEAAYKASSTMPEELQHGWDAKAKGAEHSTDPVSAFGSIGSVFAMLAPAFAGLPMSASLNAGAAAINAVHAGDEKAYNREYEAWKANTDLALKRQQIMHQTYNDATNLMNSNINAGRTKMEMAATKFGDQKVQALLDAGMDKELAELFTSRNKAAIDLQKNWDETQLQHDKVMDLRSDSRFTSGDPAQKNAAIQEWQQRWAPNGGQKLKYDYTKDYIDAQKKANPNWTPEDLAKWGKEAANAQEPDDTKGGKGANTDLTEDRQRAAYLAKTRDEKIAAGMPLEQATLEARAAADKAYPPKMSVTQQGKYQDRVFTASQTLETIDKQLGRLETRSGMTGAAGFVKRGMEKVGNVLGSDTVEAQEFAKDIALMRLNAARMLTLSQGRPLASEAARINEIIKGTSFGDLTAPTIAAMRDYQKFVQDFKKDAESRLAPGKAGGPDPEGSAASAPSGAKQPKWQSAPIVKPSNAGPRADAGTSDATDFSAMRRRLPGESGPNEGESYKPQELSQRVQEAIDYAEAHGNKMSAEEVIAMVKGLIGTQGDRLVATQRAP